MHRILIFLSTDAPIIALYDHAYSLHPGNEELANHWFMAQARAHPLNSKALQGAAMKLYRAFKRPKYFLWSVMTLYLQIQEQDGSNKMLCAIAEKMLAKGAEDDKITDFEGMILLYNMYPRVALTCIRATIVPHAHGAPGKISRLSVSA